jgi:Uri superfamily endonuclease
VRKVALLFPEHHALDERAGAYLLLIMLAQPLRFALRRRDLTLPAGTYAYAGSANGPGGIAARVARHMRKEKKPHWHIDGLTMAASEIKPLAFPGGNECSLVDRLLAAGCDVPAPGFGSSDCRACPAHLLRLSTAGGNPRAAG